MAEADLDAVIRSIAKKQHKMVMDAVRKRHDRWLGMAAKAKDKAAKARYKHLAKSTLLFATAAARRMQIAAENAADSYARAIKRAAEEQPVADKERCAGPRDAIEAVMTPEPWRILMRRLSLLLVLLFVTPALAETLDCALIKSAAHPFELTFDWTRTEKGKDPLAVQIRQQVSRKADETVIYEFFSPGKFARRTLNGAGFRMQIRTNEEAAAASRVSTYSIDVTNDYFGSGKPFDFNDVVKGADGTVVSDVNTSVSFDGTVNVEVGGCAYPLTKIIEVSHGSVRGIAGSNRAERWYSRDLKTSLYTRNEEGDGSIVETLE